MLQQISYIDDCDTLGQRVNKTDIHKVTHTTTFDIFLILSRRLLVYTKES